MRLPAARNHQNTLPPPTPPAALLPQDADSLDPGSGEKKEGAFYVWGYDEASPGPLEPGAEGAPLGAGCLGDA
jgi:hypothetical protein